MFARSTKARALVVPAFGWCTLAGCSTGSSSQPTGVEAPDSQTSVYVDAGVPSSDARPLAEYDASGVVPDDAPAGCAPANANAGSASDPPAGRLLAAGNALSARGVTSDAYEVYSDDAALQLYAIPVAGGTPQGIVALGSKFWVTVVGNVVFAWSNVTAANVGMLTVWSSAHGAHTISSQSFGILGTTSPSGDQVLYVANVDPQGKTGDVYLAGSDGTGTTTLLQGQHLSGCFPQLGFVGTYVVASHCDAERGPGPSSTISSFRAPAWTRVDLMHTAANIWSADTAATMVMVSTQNGILVVPIGGGPAKTIDAQGFLGQLIAGGQTALYGTTTGALRASSTSAPSPKTLAPSFGGFYSVSPDQNSVLYYQKSSSTGTDVELASTTTPGSQRTVLASSSGAVNGDAFTSDSTYALYSTKNDSCTGAATFNAFSLSGSASPALGNDVWGDWSATGAKVVYNDHFRATGGLRFGRADIEVVNLATGATPVRIVSQADAVLDLTPAKDQVIYSWSLEPGPLAGLYIAPIP
jgi:hypothetical protein